MIRRGVAARLGLRTPRPLATGGLVTTTFVVNGGGCVGFGEYFANLVRAGQIRLGGAS